MCETQSLGDTRFSALTGHLGQSHSLHLRRPLEVVSETGQGTQEGRASLHPFQTSLLAHLPYPLLLHPRQIFPSGWTPQEVGASSVRVREELITAGALVGSSLS